MNRHNQAVQDLCIQVRSFYSRKESFRINHGSTNSTRISGPRPNTLDISHLSNVLSIDASKRTALVEPNVPMDRLIEATIPLGLVPFVVMECPGITVGGGYNGTSGESSSFKHGFFSENILRVEMILANGDVVNCSDTERSDLFRGAAGAVGSLGVTTLVELRLREATRYVEMTYYPVSSIEGAVSKIQQLISGAVSEIDYLDGILFSGSQGAILAGRMTDKPMAHFRVRRFGAPTDPWFYLHVQEVIAGKDYPVIEVIPLAEYLFRYDRGTFWMGRSLFDYSCVPFNRFTRRIFDDFLHTRTMYTAMHFSPNSIKPIIQDLALPFSTALDFISYTTETYDIWPLWLCPLRQSVSSIFHPHSSSSSLAIQTAADATRTNSIEKSGSKAVLDPLLNIGLWGYGSKYPADIVSANRALESKLKDLGGMKWLYAATYYTEEEFWDVYDRRSYEALRERYGAESLPSVWEKVRRMGLVGNEKPTSLKEKMLRYGICEALYASKKAWDSAARREATNPAWRKF